ncbi:MAG: adenylosuccinate synthase [Roseivirga sp.]|jgi:adenylosuccinate synthase
MSVDVLLGLQWGDEGKGKIVDVLTRKYDIIARFQGGPNAGHTLEFDGIKHVLHTIPSGIFHEGTKNVIGNGVVIDPVIFLKEIDKLKDFKLNLKESLLISRKAHLILPTHRILDAASEAAKGKDKIGSTLKGIGPTYMDKTGRNGLRVGDVELADFKDRYNNLKAKHEQLLSHYQYDYQEDLLQMEKDWFIAIDKLKAMTLIDSEHYLNSALRSGEKILAEGAQGSLLDIDFGSYPFVTSSTTTCAGSCTGLGIAPNRINKVFGIFKAYCTRVGSGPFPTELFDETGEELRVKGSEFGATTGRPRRCGWLDLPALKYAVEINGVTNLIMMKSDILSGFETIKICTHYNYQGQIIDHLPYSSEDGLIEPVYTEIPGWQEDLTSLDSYDQMPDAFKNYIKFVEEQIGVPISILSVGPNRTQTIILEEVVD